MEKAQQLLKQKAVLENELILLDQQLHQQGATRTSKFTDSEGFPRSDIDILAIIELRRNLNCKQNDLKALVGEIEQAIYNVHQQQQQKEDGKEAVGSEKFTKPFARVNMVAPGSPASEAGLMVGDSIVEYGKVNESNHEKLKMLIKETTENIGCPVKVKVERVLEGKPKMVSVDLVPRRGWGGDGLLGCFILPI
ncbi:putative 26S proteasome non-ATPase regulatory subunit Nas2 [Kickxella alabastrina]|uniref:putative 26S proteasome non-ATPase regulatory subunit Nas2 n=1 Tax=Kickxella alabastrina TaxID=61397 RepID=UPI0022205022|nr:putative 26S proteasome non-ATPase regulatory subunit Nas2 [Kickxella alabastrina]KAI7833215.1 putative 26S proteasome non-ATPase regulatory subunit Nas2 [Kickxella alabastrina]